MPIEPVEQEIQDAYASLAESAAMVRYHHQHYLDGMTAPYDECGWQPRRIATGRPAGAPRGPAAIYSAP